MSWDIDIACEHCDQAKFSSNYTSNTAHMLDKAATATGWVTKDVYIGDVIDGMNAVEFSERMYPAIKWMEDNVEELRKQNPVNGWGDVDKYIAWLYTITEAADQNPTFKVKLCK